MQFYLRFWRQRGVRLTGDDMQATEGAVQPSIDAAQELTDATADRAETADRPRQEAYPVPGYALDAAIRQAQTAVECATKEAREADQKLHGLAYAIGEAQQRSSDAGYRVKRLQSQLDALKRARAVA